MTDAAPKPMDLRRFGAPVFELSRLGTDCLCPGIGGGDLNAAMAVPRTGALRPVKMVGAVASLPTGETILPPMQKGDT